jgi:hypothetical protein
VALGVRQLQHAVGGAAERLVDVWQSAAQRVAGRPAGDDAPPVDADGAVADRRPSPRMSMNASARSRYSSYSRFMPVRPVSSWATAANTRSCSGRNPAATSAAAAASMATVTSDVFVPGPTTRPFSTRGGRPAARWCSATVREIVAGVERRDEYDLQRGRCLGTERRRERATDHKRETRHDESQHGCPPLAGPGVSAEA